MSETYTFPVPLPHAATLTRGYEIPPWLTDRFDKLAQYPDFRCIQAVGALGRHMPQPTHSRTMMREWEETQRNRSRNRKALTDWEDAMTSINAWLSFLNKASAKPILAYATELANGLRHFIGSQERHFKPERRNGPQELRIPSDHCQTAESLNDFFWVLRGIDEGQAMNVRHYLYDLSTAIKALTGEDDPTKRGIVLLPDPSAFGREHRAAILAEDPHAWWASPYYPPVG